jgi:hypothetical protein
MKATIALLLTASLALGATHVFGQAAFPPPPPKVSPAAGVVDLHVHSHPDVFGRNMDDIDIANLAKARGMRGIVLKNHIGETASRAALVMKVVPGIVVSSDPGAERQHHASRRPRGGDQRHEARGHRRRRHRRDGAEEPRPAARARELATRGRPWGAPRAMGSL